MSLFARAKAIWGVGFGALLRVVHGLLPVSSVTTASTIPTTGVRHPYGNDSVLNSRTYGGRSRTYGTNRRHTY